MPKTYKYLHNAFPPVEPDMDKWAIVKLSQRREEVVAETVELALDRLTKQFRAEKSTLEEQIAKTMYLERIRMKEEPWSIDPDDEKSFWGSIKKRLIRNEHKNQGDSATPEAGNSALLREIVLRYSEEIAGRLNPRVFNFAQNVVPLMFARLLNAASVRKIQAIWNPVVNLQDRLHLTGHIEEIRKLSQKGTVVLVPTHSSNIDSILLGWAIDAIGLPPFIYGAGLNLFNNKVLGWFMGRLGAYKVDRRKKSTVYIETLKTYSTVALRAGTHSLFFPGGTRARSGALESRLKLGLMGTAMEAQRLNYLEKGDQADKIFVVPLVLSYHFVLEAQSLIYQHLNQTGKDLFYIEDESSSYWQVIKFVWEFFAKSSEMELSFGKPMDVFGNFVDEEGRSLDPSGNIIDPKAYFMTRGKITEDGQRDAEYTRMLGEKVAERYKVENVVFSSHIVAMAGFELLRKRHKELDLYSFLRIPRSERAVSFSDLSDSVGRLLRQLQKMEEQGKVKLAKHLRDKTNGEIAKHGIDNVGLYHEHRPLVFVNDALIGSDNLNLLFFYHNRLTGYGLEKYI